MKKSMLRILSTLLALFLFMPAVLAENTPNAFSFTAEFEMDAAQFDDDTKTAGGIADLLNMMTIEGSLDTMGDSFDLNFDLILYHAEETRTAFRLYGCESHWGIESSLLGNESAFMNMMALVEFAMKAYFYLDMPLQYVALCVSPYPTKDAFSFVAQKWHDVFFAEEGSRVISRDAILDLADYIGETAIDDRAFSYWVQGIALECGYDEVIFEEISAAYDWVDGFLGEEGITVTVGENGAENWTTGDLTLYESDGINWSLKLPETVDGYIVAANGIASNDRTLVNIDITDFMESSILHASADLNGLPSTLPAAFNATVNFELSGEAVGDPQSASFKGESDGSTYRLSWIAPETGAPMLTMHGTYASIPSNSPSFSQDTVGGINLLSVNDETLADFVKAVQGTFIDGMTPLLVKMPGSSYTSLFNLLNRYGVIELLTSGLQ